ncbi:MAG: hypothetical protein RI933_875 [Actinomycetota bacterium]|jgi:mannitol-1-phosphate 5-dehydrogenase
MIAVHFGAGNIGRGFIGALLHQAGYEVVFLDVNQEVVDQLNKDHTYRVIETGDGAQKHTITNFSALNSQTQFDEAAAVIAKAQVVTASVGVNVLRFLAPLIAAGLELRTASEPLVIMACENAIGATDVLRKEIETVNLAAAGKAVYSNTAVDRIVPPQKAGHGLDVLVESFSEWVIDSDQLGQYAPTIPGADFVSDLGPYIERKLFTVNTAHATLAYVGQLAGANTIVEASANSEVSAVMHKVLAETSTVLVNRHCFDAKEHQKYVAKTVARFSNPDLDDPVVRVGRQPRRKLARHDRLIGPAAYLAEMGQKPVGLLQAIEAALQFVDDSDPDVADLKSQLSALKAEEFVETVMGVEARHPLAAELTRHVHNVKLKMHSY